jgi:hypothetical protein
MCLRLCVILTALALCGCAADKTAVFEQMEAKANQQAQIEATRKQAEQAEADRNAAIQKNLIAPYDSCVRASAAQQLRINPDRNLAVENAFIACTTEEGRIRAHFRLTGSNPAVIDAAMLKRRAMLKQALVGP